MELTATVKRYLEDREYRPLYHLLCALVIIGAACLLFYQHFGGHGTLMSSDMTWPNTLARLRFQTTNTWFPFGSLPTPGDLQWFFWIYPSSTVAQWLGFSAAGYMLLVFLGTFSLAGISMYAMAYSTIRKLELDNAAPYAPYLGAVFAGLAFMYNPWAMHYLRPYFAFPIYALTPLVYLAMVKTFDNPRARNVVLFTLLISIANTSYNFAWLGGLFLSYLVFYLLKNRARKWALKAAAKVTLGTAALYLLVNALWVSPYIGAIAVGKKFLPFYSPSLNESMVQGLSAQSSTANNLRLLSIWSWSIEKLPGGTVLQALSFATPVLVLVSLILLYRKNRGNATVNYWALTATAALLLATGANSIIKSQFLWLVFDAPGSGTYGWILRSPERFLFFVAPFFALMLGILVARLLVKNPGRVIAAGESAAARLLRRLQTQGDDLDAVQVSAGPLSPEARVARMEGAAARRRFYNSAFAAFLVAAAVLASFYPKALHFARTYYNRVEVPSDYREVDKFVNRDGGEPRVAWVPFYTPANYTYQWAPNKTISYYSVMTSNPGLSSVHEVMNPDSYFRWLQDMYLTTSYPKVSFKKGSGMVKDDVLSRLLYPFSTRYLINDTSVKGFSFGPSFSADRSLALVDETKYLRVYETDQRPDYVWAATATLKANSFFDNLAVIQKLAPDPQAGLTYTDGDSFFGGAPDVSRDYGATDINDYIQVINENPGFEFTDSDGNAFYWTEYFKSPSARISTDTRVKLNGKRSLRVDNSSRKENTVAWVVSDEIPVVPEGVYGIKTSMRYRNATWTTVTLEGYNSSTEQWQQIVMCPNVMSGVSDWKSYYCSFWVPPEITAVRPVLGAGWARDASKGPATSWFDDIEVFRVNNDLFQRLQERPAAPKVTFERISAEKYRVRVRGADAPFVLVQSEAFDQLWVAKLPGGKRVDPVPLYSAVNGYPIDRPGDYDLVLEYEPQKFANIGFVISFVTLLLCLVYLLYVWRRGPVTAGAASRAGAILDGVRRRLPGGKPGAAGALAVRKRGSPGRGGVADSAGAPKAGLFKTLLARLRRLVEEPPGRGPRRFR